MSGTGELANKSLEQTNGAPSEIMAPFAAQRRRSTDWQLA